MYREMYLYMAAFAANKLGINTIKIPCNHPIECVQTKKIKCTFFLYKQQKIYAKIGVYFQKALK